MSVYEDVPIADMDFDPDRELFLYSCPCGDLFQISLDDLYDGEDIATCPSCSLLVRVIFEPDDLDQYLDDEEEEDEEGDDSSKEEEPEHEEGECKAEKKQNEVAPGSGQRAAPSSGKRSENSKEEAIGRVRMDVQSVLSVTKEEDSASWEGQERRTIQQQPTQPPVLAPAVSLSS